MSRPGTEPTLRERGDAARPSVLWVNHFAISPQEGGGTRHFELGRELVRRGWRVTIAATDFNLATRRYTRRPDADARAPIREVVEDVEFQWLWSSPYQVNDWRRARNWLTFARAVLRLGRSGSDRPSLVIGSSPHLFAALAASLLARRMGVPFVLEVRDLWPESLLAIGGRKGPGYYTLDRIARHLYRRASRIVVLARGAGRYLEELGIPPAKLAYVPNGVDVGAFSQVPPVEGGRGGLTMVYAGAHGPANGLDVVLEAAHRLRDRPGIRFLLVGDGPAKGELRARAAALGFGNVEFRDPVPKRDMPTLLASADAGLMVLRDTPLFSFGVSPNKLFDYLGAGLPVVCNVPGEVAEMAAASGAGVQADDASADALAEAILRLDAEAGTERRRRGALGRAWVEREHGRPVVAARLDAMLRELLPG